MTGAAPVPVPPPMPAVMKHMCAPSSCSTISSMRFLGGGAADLGPGAGAEAPVTPAPSWMLGGAATLLQRLRVGVGDDELAAIELDRRSCC